MIKGALNLGAVAVRIDTLAVSCTHCARFGRYRMDALMARHGAGFGVPALLRILSGDCPRRVEGTVITELCGIRCPELPQLFLGR